jgi:hypothetical protein
MRSTILKSATTALLVMFASSALAAPSFPTVKKDAGKAAKDASQ